MVQHYREMVDDPLRISAFRDAIRAEIRPGEVAADIGCGLGTYAVFACRAGAERVYAVDDGPVLEVAREVARVNGCGEHVRFLAGRSTELEPQERVDVAIFEDYVAGLLTPGIVGVLRDLRTRWLKPGGRLLPARARLYTACVESSETHRALDRFEGTKERVFGIDLTPARRSAFASPRNVKLAPASLLTAPLLLQDLDLAAIDELRLQGTVRAPATRDGVVHGVLVWFDLALPPRGWLGTGPLDPPSAWRQLYLPFETPLAVAEGSSIEVEVAAAALGDSMVWRWRARSAEAQASAHSLDALTLGKGARQGSRPDRIPPRSAELALDSLILAAVDGARDVASIAEVVRTAEPARFPTAADAEARIGRTLARYLGAAAG
ncbi:MAG: class I SAM-dependent methyltransferase [Polyangia bacterium]